MAKKKKNKLPIQRVRKQNMTDRDRLNTMVIPDKKKGASKKKCRKPLTDED